jgi:hypothetical protein
MPTAPDRDQWLQRRASGWSAKGARTSTALLLFLTVTGLAIWAVPRGPLGEHTVIVHTAIGLLGTIPLVWYLVRHVVAYWSFPMTHVKVTGFAAGAMAAACTVSGFVLTWDAAFGTRIVYAWRTVHLVTTFGLLALLVPHLGALWLRERRGQVVEVVAGARGHARAALFGTAALLVPVAVLTAAVRPIDPVNEFPVDYDHDEYGDRGPFAPSLAQTSTGGAFDARSLSGSESCGVSGCHEEIYAEWLPSAHRYASMDPGFQKIQSVMADQNGPVSTRYCGGCHDPISLFSGTKNIGVEDLSSLEGYQEGISCLACHAIEETDVKGNANYVIHQPDRYAWEQREGALSTFLANFTLRAYPEKHVETLSRRMFKTPEFCAACHKQFIDEEVNQVGWVQLQNQYDNWKASRWHHEDDPTRTIECRECHMPLADSSDPAAGDAADFNRTAGDGKHRSHRFLGANQYIPTLLDLPGAEEHVALIEQWLRGEFEIPEIADRWSDGPAVPIEIEAPASVAPGDSVDLFVRAINNKVGHDFPTGPLDIIQAWIEVEVTDQDVQGRARRPLRQPDRPPQPVGDGRRALQALHVPGPGGGRLLRLRLPGLGGPGRTRPDSGGGAPGRSRGLGG